MLNPHVFFRCTCCNSCGTAIQPCNSNNSSMYSFVSNAPLPLELGLNHFRTTFLCIAFQENSESLLSSSNFCDAFQCSSASCHTCFRIPLRANSVKTCPPPFQVNLIPTLQFQNSGSCKTSTFDSFCTPLKPIRAVLAVWTDSLGCLLFGIAHVKQCSSKHLLRLRLSLNSPVTSKMLSST